MVQTDRSSGGTLVVPPEKKYIAFLILMIAAQVAVLVYFGARKAGFHEDVFYSYFSSNRSAGLYTPDGEWVDTETILNEFRVLPGERFHFGTVKLVQSWDVHPPLWYFLLHFACSLSAGVFSKWQGLAVNIVGFVIAQLLLAKLSRLVMRTADRGGVYRGDEVQEKGLFGLSRDQLGALAVAAAWGFSPAAVSAVMFIRMYVWLTVFVLAMLILHVQFLQMLRESAAMRFGTSAEGAASNSSGNISSNSASGASSDSTKKNRRREYLLLFISMTVVSFLGFMTQYYYLIALFFAGIYTAAVLLRYLVTAGKNADRTGNGNISGADKKAIRRNIFRLAGAYVCSQAAAGIIGVLYYPAALSHIFRGYRGKEAQAEFLNVGNTFGRVRAFFSLVSRYAFGGWMLVFLIAALAAAVAAAVKKVRIRQEVRLLIVVCAGYFLAVAKTGLILGETSIRYEIPICPVFILLILCGLSAFQVSIAKYLPVAAAVLLLVLDLAGLVGGRVLFLYPENEARITFAREHCEEPAILLFNPQSPDHVWWIPDVLLQYPKVYFLSEGNAVHNVEQLREAVRDGAGAL
ncbi:MAG: hypothetical protein J5969_02695 [Lachnospiraceae bacterium]|nr:hypothetical protein [Lachnospiraceae bacterium]